MGTSIQDLHLHAEDFGGPELEGCNENLVRTRPDLIRNLHLSFLQAGADIIETNSFGSTSVVLTEYGLQADARELNRTAAAIAREAADSVDHCGPAPLCCRFDGADHQDHLGHRRRHLRPVG